MFHNKLKTVASICHISKYDPETNGVPQGQTGLRGWKLEVRSGNDGHVVDDHMVGDHVFRANGDP